MPAKKSTPQSKVPKGPKAVPEWAKRVKAYREGTGKTQLEIQNAIHAKVNTVSLVERGIREFTAVERKLFFEFIGKPEDLSIPCKLRERKPKVTKKAAKPAKNKSRKEGKAGKGAKAPNAAQVPISSEAAPMPIPDPAIKSAPPAPSPTKKAKVLASQKSPRLPRVRKPSLAPAPMTVSKAVEKAAKRTTPKAAGENKALKVVKGALIQPAPSSISAISPVKEAVLRDMSRILSNPGLSDNHAKRLHSLFTSLAVNALLGE